MAVDIDREFDRQVNVLLAKQYPKITGHTEQELVSLLEPLRVVVHKHAPSAGVDNNPSRASFVLVVSDSMARTEDLMPLTTLAGRSEAGIVVRNHGPTGLIGYRPLPELAVPAAPAYVLFDIERGEEFRGVAPRDALPVIAARNRTPVTIHEGIAVVTQFPAMLEKNHCFMLSGSRKGDRRVPAMWISGKAPKLGWCWEGNPHTWLGTASAATRAA